MISSPTPSHHSKSQSPEKKEKLLHFRHFLRTFGKIVRWTNAMKLVSSSMTLKQTSKSPMEKIGVSRDHTSADVRMMLIHYFDITMNFFLQNKCSAFKFLSVYVGTYINKDWVCCWGSGCWIMKIHISTPFLAKKCWLPLKTDQWWIIHILTCFLPVCLFYVSKTKNFLEKISIWISWKHSDISDNRTERASLNDFQQCFQTRQRQKANTLKATIVSKD
jgi:hypothetical protein